jgi:hypothetical protein
VISNCFLHRIQHVLEQWISNTAVTRGSVLLFQSVDVALIKCCLQAGAETNDYSNEACWYQSPWIRSGNGGCLSSIVAVAFRRNGAHTTRKVNRQGAKGRTYSVVLFLCKTIEHIRYNKSRAINQIRNIRQHSKRRSLAKFGCPSEWAKVDLEARTFSRVRAMN